MLGVGLEEGHALLLLPLSFPFPFPLPDSPFVAVFVVAVGDRGVIVVEGDHDDGAPLKECEWCNGSGAKV